MNGITLLIPEVLARVMFGFIGVINCFLIAKCVYPQYTQAYNYYN